MQCRGPPHPHPLSEKGLSIVGISAPSRRPRGRRSEQTSHTTVGLEPALCRYWLTFENKVTLGNEDIHSQPWVAREWQITFRRPLGEHGASASLAWDDPGLFHSKPIFSSFQGPSPHQCSVCSASFPLASKGGPLFLSSLHIVSVITLLLKPPRPGGLFLLTLPIFQSSGS